MKLSEATYFPDAKELTRHGFVSHMEDFIGKLIGDNPLSADVDDYLKDFDIDAPKAIEMLTKREIEDVPESAVVIRTEKIINGGTDEFGKPMKDKFQVIYKVPKRDPDRGIKGIDEKLRNMYIKLFENHIVKGTILNEDDGGGFSGTDGALSAADCNDTAPSDEPFFGMVRRKGYSPKTTKNENRIRRTMYITEDQMRELAKLLKEEAVMDTAFGNFGFDAPVGDGKNNKGNDFYKEANDRDGILTRKKNTAKWNKNLEEEDSGIHIKKKNKGKFTATKKRTGKSTEELTHSKNPLTRKRAIFAQNAKKWNKK